MGVVWNWYESRGMMKARADEMSGACSLLKSTWLLLPLLLMCSRTTNC